MSALVIQVGEKCATSETKSVPFSVAALFAERDERRRRDKAADEYHARRKEQELAARKQRVDEFKLTEDRVQAVQQRIGKRFEHGQTELMLASFAGEFCSDGGRAIINAGAPLINTSSKEEVMPLRDADPGCVTTLPRGERPVCAHWKSAMKPAGFQLRARIINFPGGKTGDVGTFFSWSKSVAETRL